MPSEPLFIGFLSIGNAHIPSAWSGTVFHMAQTLESQGAKLGHIGPMDQSPLRLDKLAAKWRRKLGGSPSAPLRSQRAERIFAKQIQYATGKENYDVLFSPAGSVLVAGLREGLPVIYSSDCTTAQIRDYYPRYKKMTRSQLARLEALEQQAIDRANLLIYPTQWAASSAIQDYSADPSKVHVLPYGANLPAPSREAALSPRPDGPLELIFIGVNWKRKGGAIAIEALDALKARGIDAHMTIIGCTPPEGFIRPNVTVIPFLKKNDPLQRDRLVECYLKADFLILPTRQECYGIVFCEAAAHGVPSIASETGGVPDVIQDGVTGKIVPLTHDGRAYADAIEALLSAPGGLEGARLQARNDYETRLNWECWGQAAIRLMSELC